MLLKYFMILTCVVSWSVAQEFKKIWETAVHPETILSGTITLNGKDYIFAQDHWQLSIYRTDTTNNSKRVIEVDSAKNELLYTVLPDISGNGSDELWFEQSFASEHNYRKGIRIVDGETGVTIFEKNDPSKSFFYPYEYGAGVQWDKLSPVGDFNGDGLVELLIASGNSDHVTDSSILMGYQIPVSNNSFMWSTHEYLGTRHGLFFLQHSNTTQPYFYRFIDPLEMVVMRYQVSQDTLYSIRFNDSLPPPNTQSARILRVVSDVSGDGISDLFFEHAFTFVNGSTGRPIFKVPIGNIEGMLYSSIDVDDVEHDGMNEIVRIDDNIILDEEAKFPFGQSTSRLTLYETTGKTLNVNDGSIVHQEKIVGRRSGGRSQEFRRTEDNKVVLSPSRSHRHSALTSTPAVKWQSPVFTGGANAYLDPIQTPTGFVKTLTVSDTGSIRIMISATSAAPRISIPLSYGDGELFPYQYPISSWVPLRDITGDGYGDVYIIRTNGFRVVDGVTGEHIIDESLLNLPLVDAWIFTQGDLTKNKTTDLAFYVAYEHNGEPAAKLMVYETHGIVTTLHDRSGRAKINFELEQNYPNPFNPVTELKFTIPSDGPVLLRVYNILGQQVAELVNGNREGGKVHSVRFNGSALSSGVYLSVLEYNGMRSMVKMLLLK